MVRIEKYVGRGAVIIYEDSKGNLTMRKVTVYSVQDGIVRVMDWEKRAFRTLRVERILSAMPVIGRAG